MSLISSSTGQSSNRAMLRFVLLEHDWNGSHWDFMLETEPGGPLRAWAVDAPVVSGVDLPARALADHRGAYLDYEGEVSGGRGTVRRVDRGEYERLVWAEDLVRVRVAGDQLAGLVSLRRGVTGMPAGGTDGAGPEPRWTFRLGNFD